MVFPDLNHLLFLLIIFIFISAGPAPVVLVLEDMHIIYNVIINITS